MTPLIIAHVPSCRWKGKGHTDAAKRISDATNLHKVASGWDSIGKFIACRLSDGTGGIDLYDSYRDAVRIQSARHDEFLYIRLRAEGMTVCEAELYLWVNRQARDNGFKLSDPDDSRGGKTLIPRIDPQHNNLILKGLMNGNRTRRNRG
jgi:hypothetical protein